MMQLPRPAVNDIVVQHVSLEAVIDVRHHVLRSCQDRSSCYYPEDSYKNTVHFAANAGDTIIACASIYKESHPNFKLKQSWRIRGMAVLPEYQRRKIGSQLLEACVNHAISKKADVVWCNARINTVKFYKHAGFKVLGDEFEIVDIGPHFLLAKNLGIHIGHTHFMEIAKKIFAKEPPLPVPQSKLKP